jgi:hypothetical protein
VGEIWRYPTSLKFHCTAPARPQIGTNVAVGSKAVILKVGNDYRPSSNRRCRRYTVPPCGNCGASLPVSCPPKRAGDCLRIVRSDEAGDRNRPAPRHGSLPNLKGVHPSRCEAALKPVDLQGWPMEVREPPVAMREEAMQLQKARARLRAEPMRWQQQPTGLRTPATGPRPEETGLGRAASAAPSPPWIAARCAH